MTAQIEKPRGAFRLSDVPKDVRLAAATHIIRRERLERMQAVELKLAAIAPSKRLYVLTGESA